MSKPRLFPEGMLRRWPTLLIWLVALSFTTFGNPELAATMVTFALAGVGLAFFLFLLWGPRTRPVRNAFWFLVHVVLIGGLIAMSGFRPVMGALAAFPVTLMWLHDAPSSPSAMLTWGVVLVLWQPELWSDATADLAWDIVMAVILMIGAAQFERNRLASKQYTQAGIIFSMIRLLAVFGLSILFVAGREGLRAVNAFTYIGIDASGVAGKITMLGFVIVGIALAVMLFRVRPDKPQVTVTSASQRVDFDESPDKVAKKVDKATHVSTRVAKAADANRERAARTGAKPAPKKKEPAKPGELDFD